MAPVHNRQPLLVAGAMWEWYRPIVSTLASATRSSAATCGLIRAITASDPADVPPLVGRPVRAGDVTSPAGHLPGGRSPLRPGRPGPAPSTPPPAAARPAERCLSGRGAAR